MVFAFFITTPTWYFDGDFLPKYSDMRAVSDFFLLLEEDLEVVEDIKCDEGLAVRLGKPKAECQKHKLKIPKTNKMKNFLKGKFKRKSKFEAPLTPTALLGKIGQCVFVFFSPLFSFSFILLY